MMKMATVTTMALKKPDEVCQGRVEVSPSRCEKSLRWRSQPSNPTRDVSHLKMGKAILACLRSFFIYLFYYLLFYFYRSYFHFIIYDVLLLLKTHSRIE